MIPGRARYGLVVGAALVVIVLDQLTKSWALSSLEPGRPEPVLWTLQLNLQRNSGAAFSFGAGTSWGRWLPLAALVVVVALLWRGHVGSTRWGALALGLVLGGALGNQIDRLVRTDGGGFYSGRVIDFLDLQWWPVFNVADMGVVVGSILLVVVSFFAEDGAAAPDDAPAAPAEDAQDEPGGT